ncbi:MULTISPECIES: diacylglycerol/lipid kinase family protein [Halorussus]|uniref:diacylglycerol/lipid kinase family protein n=1 Tax=Halorussus TaxID=1070314 RepID=UPI00209FFE54|nr:diacylglycerol kinase family protein [Halorussus vallis]USZ77126.1 diacylglycerol kinase family lipid kinase [Halorussus vallis]
MTVDGVGSTGDLASTDDVHYDRVVVLNPVSGNGGHRDRVRNLADEFGYTVLETRSPGEAVEFGRLLGQAGIDLVAAAGGDGTLNEVARGLDAADALGEATFGVVPTGTGNNLAGNVGVRDIEHAFEVLESGERRRIDVGTGDSRLFLNSCVAGLTADASASTTPEMKERLGVLAYVVCGLRAVTEFDALPLCVEASGPDGDRMWSGEAVTVLVGNVRRFPAMGRSQANCEDGLLDVTIVEQMPSGSLLEEAAVQRLFGDETEHVTHLTASELGVTVQRDDPVGFSFDGEINDYNALSMRTREKAMTLCVGEDYEPTP